MSEPQLNTAAALHLLCAWRRAGSRVYVDAEGDLLVSPPAHPVVWPGNPERAIDDLYWQLRELVIAEDVDRPH